MYPKEKKASEYSGAFFIQFSNKTKTWLSLSIDFVQKIAYSVYQWFIINF